MEETANFESNAIMKVFKVNKMTPCDLCVGGECLTVVLRFKDVTNLLPEWEDGNFHLAKYYDKVMPMVTDNKLEKQGNLIRYIVLYFGKWVAFQHGENTDTSVCISL